MGGRFRAAGGFVALLMAFVAVLAIAGGGVGAQTPTSSIAGTVLDDGEAAVGLSVDLFLSDQSGSRLSWLTSTTTDTDGYQFEVAPGCYVVTFIADPSRRFTNNTLWSNVPVCVADGESRTGIGATLRSLVPAVISGGVGDADDGRPLPNIQVDLFAAAGDGSRGRYIESTVTRPGSGAFSFEVSGGCYVVTYIGEADQTFVESGTRWLERSACVEAGASRNLGRAELRLQPGGRILAKVRRSGQEVEGVQIDLFTDNGSGQRERYVSTHRTNERGSIDVTANAGCYILTFIAPAGATWEGSDQIWLNQGVCIEPGDQKNLFGNLLAEQDQRITLEIAVKRGGVFAEDVTVDIYAADADGNRGEFQDSATTRGGRETILHLEPGLGCWILTFVAPIGEVFAETGTRSVDRPFCTNPDQTVYSFAADLVPPPGSELAVDVRDGPQTITGRADSGGMFDLLITATPGREVGIEFVSMTVPGCDRSTPLTLRAFHGDSERGFGVRCSSFGPLTTADDGSLTIRLTGEDVGFQAIVAQSGEVTEFPPVDLSGGSAELAGEVTGPFGRSRHVVTGVPGQFVSFQLAGPVCDVGEGLSLWVTSPADDYRPSPNRPFFNCQPQGVWQFPSDGQLMIDMLHSQGPTSNGVVDRSYQIALDMFPIEQRVLPIDRERFEFTESVDGFAGPDYVIDLTAVDAVRFTMVDRDGSGVCDPSVGLKMILFVEGQQPGIRRIGCDDRAIGLASFDADTITARIYSDPGDSLAGSTVGPFSLIIDQLMYEAIDVDLTNGPVDVTGSIDLPYDRIDYQVRAEPGQLVSVVDVDRWANDSVCEQPDEISLQSRNQVDSESDDALLFRWPRGCARIALERVPESGILSLQVSARPEDKAGDFGYTFTPIDNRQVAVDLANGPVDVTETLTLPLEGTWYQITGTPGHFVEGVFTSLVPSADPGADCASNRFGLDISYRNRFNSIISIEVGRQGCTTYELGQIGADGNLLVLVKSGGTGTDYQGSYAMTITDVGP